MGCADSKYQLFLKIATGELNKDNISEFDKLFKQLNLHQDQLALDSFLFLSCHYGNYTSTKYLLDNGANINSTINKDHYLKKISRGGYFPKIPGFVSPLFVACFCDYINIIHLGIDYGADFQKIVEIPPTKVFYGIDIKLLKILYKDPIGLPLKIIISSGHIKLLKKLHNKEINLKFKDKKGNTLLHHAAASSQPEICKFFVEEVGIDVNTKGLQGETPLHIATVTNNIENINLLIESGANIDIPDCKGRTALYIARKKNYDEIAKLLIKYGAEDIPDINGTKLFDF